MEPQPSTSAGAGVSKAGAPDGDPSPSDGAEEAVSSTSGDSVPEQDQPQEQQLVWFGGGAYLKQCQQLFGATCRVKVQRCQLATTTVAKVEDSDSTGSGSSSEDDDIKVLPAPPPAAPLSKKKRVVTKKKRGKTGRKSPANCTVCKKTFSSKSYLKIHLRKHSGDKKYKCEKCGRSFWCPVTFRNRKKARDQRNGVCPRENKKYDGVWRPKGAWTCKTCGKKMKNRGSYWSQMRIHRGDKPFKCGECGKGFGRKAHLSDHGRIHTGTCPYTCVFCDKGFHQQSNLFSHLRVHTEEKPYFCEVDGCGASFRHSASLKWHRQSIH